MSPTNVYFLLFAGKPKKQLLSNAANHSATWKVIILRLWYSKKDCSDVSRWSDNLGRLLMHLMFSVMISALKVIDICEVSNTMLPSRNGILSIHFKHYLSNSWDISYFFFVSQIFCFDNEAIGAQDWWL